MPTFRSLPGDKPVRSYPLPTTQSSPWPTIHSVSVRQARSVQRRQAESSRTNLGLSVPRRRQTHRASPRSDKPSLPLPCRLTVPTRTVPTIHFGPLPRRRAMPHRYLTSHALPCDNPLPSMYRHSAPTLTDGPPRAMTYLTVHPVPCPAKPYPDDPFLTSPAPTYRPVPALADLPHLTNPCRLSAPPHIGSPPGGAR